MIYNSFLLPALSTSFIATTPYRVKFMEEQRARVANTLFTSREFFDNYPMDEISLSLESGDITIPSHLQTADEIDEWIMSL